MIHNIQEASLMMQGLLVSLIGLVGVFLVLILFYFFIRFMQKIN